MSRANVARYWRTQPYKLARLPGHEYRLMEKFAAEAIKAQRDQAIKSAVKAKVPLYDIMADFDLTEAEIAAVLKDEYGPPGKPKSDIIDARDEPKLRAARR